MYYADWWWPATMLVVTSLVVVLIVSLARRNAEMVRERERLLTYGCRVPADVEVTARISSTESGSKAVGATVTVSFVDLAEVRHLATCRTTDVGVATGAGAAEVLFDPERPTHEKSIFVALRRRPALSDRLPVG